MTQTVSLMNRRLRPSMRSPVTRLLREPERAAARCCCCACVGHTLCWVTAADNTGLHRSFFEITISRALALGPVEGKRAA